MKFLLDQDVYFATARFLSSLGHDVVLAADIGCAQTDDRTLLKIAQEQHRIFVTRDRDFGNLVFNRGMVSGVIYLQVLPSNLRSSHFELERMLSAYKEDEIGEAFIVIGPGRHRFRRLSKN